jgi:hypothetical protein
MKSRKDSADKGAGSGCMARFVRILFSGRGWLFWGFVVIMFIVAGLLNAALTLLVEQLLRMI